MYESGDLLQSSRLVRDILRKQMKTFSISPSYLQF
jgi:hypothetical protein